MTGFLLCLYLLLLSPKLVYDRLRKGKKHPGFSARFGFSLPKLTEKTIWIHAVSVGEVKAAQPLFRALKKEFPLHSFLITTTTATGQAEAKRSLSSADAFSYAPVDFKWVVRLWMKKVRPEMYILLESDFWPNLLSELKKSGCKNILVSGKLSERSYRRFKWVSSFGKKLFSLFDLLCVQNEEHLNRFRFFAPKKLCQTGNLKLDIEPQCVDLDFWKQKLPLGSAITVSCTHAPEEEWLIDQIPGTIFLAPRHPERFEEVAQLLAKKQIPFIRWSQLDERRGGERVILVDAMGQLPICYSLSRLAIVGGSFVPGIGGHNVLEPCLYGIPVLFGPYMHTQTEFSRRVQEARAGIQISVERVKETVEEILRNREKEMRSRAVHLIESSRGSASRTAAEIVNLRGQPERG